MAKPQKIWIQGSGLKIKSDHLEQMRDSIRLLTQRQVMVGFPDETADRKPDPAEPVGITNASLAYVHDNGQPEHNIPARPFMIPGMNDAIGPVTKQFESLAKKIMRRASLPDLEAAYIRVGIVTATAIKRKVNEGIPPPLADATLRARARKGRKGAKEELARRAAGDSPSTALAKPLIDTGQLRNAITYVIRKRKKGI